MSDTVIYVLFCISLILIIVILAYFLIQERKNAIRAAKETKLGEETIDNEIRDMDLKSLVDHSNARNSSDNRNDPKKSS